MKKILSLLALLMCISHTTWADEVTFDFENNPKGWPVGEGVNFADGNLTAPLDVDGVLLTGVQGDATQPVRIMKTNDGIISLYVYNKGAIKFNAPEGKALVKIAVTMKSGSSFDLTANNGTIAEDVWTGNAMEVIFTSSGTRSITKLIVTTADKNSETVEPVVETYDVEAANIAEFNAVEDGKIVKLTLNNAQVNIIDSWTKIAYIEDEKGATTLSGADVAYGNILSGYIIGKKSSSTLDYSNPSWGSETKIAVTTTDALTITDGTPKATATTVNAILDATTTSNHGRLLTISDVDLTKTGNRYYVYRGEEKVCINDFFSVLSSDFVWPEKAKTITGLCTFNGAYWQLAPVTANGIIAAGEQPTEATFDFASESIRENIGTGLTDVKGYIYNETFTAENVTLQITGGSAPSRIYKDTNRGQNLVTYKEYTTLTFKAPENYAITKIEFTAAGNSNINNFNASSGTIEGMTWTGNVDGVRFAQGGTSYLAKAVVTLAAKTTETAALPAIEYTECANIAAFNALAAGTYAKVTLTDAEVTGVSADGYSTVFIQDATGGCWIQYTSLNDKLKEKTKVNGTVYVVARPNSGNVQMKEAEDTPKSEITATDISDYTIVEGTLAEVNVAANLNKVVKITGAELTETSDTAGKLKQGDATIDVNNGAATANQQLHKIAEWTNGTNLENVTIVAILVGKSATANQLLPISMEATATGIENINADITNGDVKIYNLQGVRLNKLQKGVNIVNGRKVVIK